LCDSVTTDDQISFTVDFWANQLRATKKVSQERLLRFERELTKLLSEDREIRAACCHFGPHSTLEYALKKAEISSEPPVITVDIDLVMNPDGTIDIREGKHWRKENP
jgi:hypothetical protein